MIVLANLTSAIFYCTASMNDPGSGSAGAVINVDLGPVDITQVDQSTFIGTPSYSMSPPSGSFGNTDLSVAINPLDYPALEKWLNYGAAVSESTGGGSGGNGGVVVFIQGTLFSITVTVTLIVSHVRLVLTYADGTVVTLTPGVSKPYRSGPFEVTILGSGDGVTVEREIFGGLIFPPYAVLAGFNIPTVIAAPNGPDWLIINEPTLGITNRSSYLSKSRASQHSWTGAMRNRWQATVPLYIAAGDTYAPTQFTPLYLFDQSSSFRSPLVTIWTLVFSGLIQDIEDQWIGTAGDRFVIVTAVSLESVFDTVYAKPVQYQDFTCGAIVRDLFSRWEGGAPVSLGTIHEGKVIALLVTNYEKLSDLFDQLATTSGYTWGVNPQTAELYFQEPSTNPVLTPGNGPFQLASSNILWETVNWKQSGADYRNRQAVRLSYDAFAHSCEFFVGAGQRVITLMRPVEQVTNAWATLSTCNTATGTFTGVPNDGDTISTAVPTGTWIPNHIYALNGTLIDQNGFVQKVTTAGTSGGTYPTFSDITGQPGIPSDGTVIWTCQGPAGLATGDAVYTFKTAIDNTQYGQVLIAPDAATQALYLSYAINATVDDGGSPPTQYRGVYYSLPTWENALCNAINPSAGAFTLQQKHAGTGWITSLSEACTNFTWSAAATSGGTSPQGSLGPGEGATISLQVYVAGTSVAAPGVAYTPGSRIVTLATPLNVGSNLNIEYTRADGNIIEVEDTALVTALATISHGTGKYQQIVDASSQGLISTSNVAGLQLAQQALAAYSVPPQSFSFVTYAPGFFPGQQLPVLLTLPNGSTTLLNGDWVIQEVDAELVEALHGSATPWLMTGAGHYKYTVRCVDISEIGSYLDFWKGQGGGGSGGGSGSGGAIAATSGGGLAPAPPIIPVAFPAISHEFLTAYDATSGAFTAAAIAAADLPAAITAGTLGITIDGGGATPATGSKGFLQVNFACTITGWTMLADQSGSAQITVKKSTYSGFPTTSSIVASAPPNLSTAQKNTSTTLTGWTTAIAAGDVLEFNLDSVTTCQRITLELKVTKG